MAAIKQVIQNLTKTQKISIWVICATIAVGVLIFIIVDSNKTVDSFPVDNIQQQDFKIPAEQYEKLTQYLYSFLSSKYNITKNTIVEDIKIRDDTYEQNTSGNTVTAKFIIDIDSLKATYQIKIFWSTNSSDYIPDPVSISCPPKDKMKYPETFCESPYNNTASPNLYLPYVSYSNPQDTSTIQWQILLSQMRTNTIIIGLRTCGDEVKNKEYRAAAHKWLDSTPIKQNLYTIEEREYCSLQTMLDHK